MTPYPRDVRFGTPSPFRRVSSTEGPTLNFLLIPILSIHYPFSNCWVPLTYTSILVLLLVVKDLVSYRERLGTSRDREDIFPSVQSSQSTPVPRVQGRDPSKTKGSRPSKSVHPPPERGKWGSWETPRTSWTTRLVPRLDGTLEDWVNPDRILPRPKRSTILVTLK